MIQQLFTISGWNVSFLDTSDLISIQALLEKCADYCQLASGSEPGPDAAVSLLSEIPEGKQLEDKVTIGIKALDGSLVGLLEVIRNYPGFSDWWIGLLLFDPAYRSQGLGCKTYCAFERWAGENGATEIYLGVLEPNQKAYYFWHMLGFEEVYRREPVSSDEAGHVVIVMKKPVQLGIC
jgi:GNAT superfamily N-acetyltransferase